MGTLVSGGSLVVPNKFSVSTFWETIKACNCTWFSVVPTQISYLLHETGNNPPTPKVYERLRFGRSASAPLSPEMHEAFETRFNIPIIETMGLTETAAQILSNPVPPGRRKVGSPGVAVGNEVIIADQNQKEVQIGEEGEILVRGPNVLRCYLKNEDATKQAITAEGWLRTGDLGRMDAEGYVFVTGRLKELIIKGGENIAPREIDEALYSHPDVIEAAAFAVDCRNYGQRIEACVKLRKNSDLTQEMLIEICHHKLGVFKSPDSIHILEELPKGPSGKIQRIKLPELISLGREL
jgi:acyl-CoA synthetase (AMP-forming)/AMP-acid ligase II